MADTQDNTQDLQAKLTELIKAYESNVSSNIEVNKSIALLIENAKKLLSAYAKDESSIDEIKESLAEDKELLKELETLINEFESKFNEFNKKLESELSEFSKEYENKFNEFRTYAKEDINERLSDLNLRLEALENKTN